MRKEHYEILREALKPAAQGFYFGGGPLMRGLVTRGYMEIDKCFADGTMLFRITESGTYLAKEAGAGTINLEQRGDGR